MNSAHRTLRKAAICIFSRGDRWILASAVMSGVVLALTALVPHPALARKQSNEELNQELVANIAAGRVYILVAKNGMVIASTANRIEAASLLPTVVALNARRAGILFGAVDWVSVDDGKTLARLDRDLPHLHGSSGFDRPRLQQDTGGGVASDIQSIGEGLFHRLHDICRNLHAKIDSPENEPLVELVIAGYLPGYGPEVWTMRYSITQLPLRGEYYETQVTPPQYEQLWPPEKDQPKTIMEIEFPPDAKQPANEAIRPAQDPGLLTRLRDNDPRLQAIRADAANSEVASAILSGDTRKVSASAAAQFLRAALAALSAKGTPEAIAAVNEETGFDWVLPPPREAQTGPRQARPPGAPTLIKPDDQ